MKFWDDYFKENWFVPIKKIKLGLKANQASKEYLTMIKDWEKNKS